MELTVKNGLLALHNGARKLQSAITTTCIILFCYVIIVATMFTASFYKLLFGEVNPRGTGFVVFTAGFALLVFALIPVLANKYIFRKSLADIGLQMPPNKIRAILLGLIGLACSIPIFIYLIQQPSIKQYYSVGSRSIYFFFGVQIFVFPAYYYAEELFFRGFLFLTLWERIGWHSFWISEIFFALAHLGKPPLEIIVSVPVGMMLNYITLRTRSFYPALFVHTSVGMLTFTLININSVKW